MTNPKRQRKKNRQRRVRARIIGTGKRPRLSVFRSLRGIYAQLIDDSQGRTLAVATSKEISQPGRKSEVASAVGKLLAQKALAMGITEVVFDRAGFRYHGRVKMLAEGARLAGLKF